MTAHWYCLINDREHGPFTSQQIQRLAEKGKLKPEHSVRPETDSHWTPALAIPGLFPDSEADTTPPVAKAAPPKVARKASAKQPPSPPSAEVPRAIPVADAPSVMPVAKPVAKPVATPVAKPVATPIATPVGGAGPPSDVSGVATPPPAPTMRPRDRGKYAKRGRRKSQQLYIVVGALIGLTLILGGVAMIVIMKGPPRDKVDVPVTSIAPSVNEDVGAGSAESDPYAGTTPSQDAPAAKRSTVSFPTLGRWLDASRQKGGLRGVAKLGVSDAWMEKTAADVRVLNIDVKITNLAPDKSLNFRGWSGGGTSAVDTRALLADDQGGLLKQLPAQEGATVRRIKSDQSHTARLRFSLADSTSSSFRLALPYAAIGHTGHLGFEIPILMIQTHPPGDDAPDDAATASGAKGDVQATPALEFSAREDASGETGSMGSSVDTEKAPEAVPEALRGGGQPETIKDLRRSIDEEAAADAMDGP